MNSKSDTPRVLAVFVMVLLLTGAAFADDDPPARVMRLRYVGGQISMQPGGVNDWVEATINRPFATADRIWADKESRAELSLGTATLRIKDETSMTISNLTDDTVQMELDQGTLNLRVRKMYPGEIYEVDTPNVAFTLLKPGDYRFEVDSERNETLVIVRKGEGEGTGDGAGVRVRSGEEVRFENGNTLMHRMADARGFDGFDDWCRARDKREDSAESLRYVPADMVGYEDLDENGTWREYPEYGPVWVPRHVAVDWAPYSYGHWVWVEPWGWTWVDDAPWGFAPFHYGRWVHIGGFWGWSPGPRHVRPVYAPALVAWVGGNNWGVSVSIGRGVGWVPLGYGEPYYPWYRVSNNYVRNVNITNTRIVNITNVTNNYTIINSGRHVDEHYINQRVRGGVTMVDHDAFANGRPVGGSRLRVSDRDIAAAPISHQPGVAPMRGGVLGAGQGRRASAPPAGVVGKPVWAKEHPPERPIPFERRQPVIERNGGRPLDNTQVNELRSQRGRDNGRQVPNTAAGAPAIGRGDRRGRDAAPEMKGQPGSGNPNADAQAQHQGRLGRSVPKPGGDRTAEERQPGVRPSHGMRRADGGDDQTQTPPRAEQGGGPIQKDRMPRATTPETPAQHSDGQTLSTPMRDNRGGVPRPPRESRGNPEVNRGPRYSDVGPQSGPAERGNSGNADRGYDRNIDRSSERPREQAPVVKPERPQPERVQPQPEVRRPNPDPPAARPAPQERHQQPAAERQQRPPQERPRQEPKQERKDNDKAPKEGWRGK